MRRFPTGRHSSSGHATVTILIVDDAALNYWIAQLANAPRTVELPFATHGPGDRIVDRIEFALDESVAASLEAVASAEYVTLSEVLLSGFAALVYRYAKQDELVFGVVGSDGTTVAVRVQVDGSATFADLIGHTYAVTSSAEFYRGVSWDAVVEALGCERTDGRHPLFEIAFAMREGDATVAMPACDLAFVATRTTTGISCRLEYNAARYPRGDIERLAVHFQHLLVGAGATSSLMIDALPLLSSAERQQVLVDWNQTARDYPRDRCLHQLVEAHVDRTPDAIAVVLDGAELTYGELERRTNQLAHHLIGLGAGPEVKVAVLVERSIDMVVAIVAILKAGAAYVPLETKSPADRLAFILDDASASIVVSQARFLELLEDVSARLVRLDDDAAVIAHAPASRPQTGVRPENLAYVIYTSGSTGRPKGVQIEHRHIVNLVIASGVVEGIRSTDRMLQFSSIAFDSSVEELFTPLVHGATLVLRGEDVPGALDLFGPRFAGVTVMNMATAYWHAIAMALKGQSVQRPAALRMINIGGERALPEYLRQWDDLLPGCILHNQYGPTEATVMATSWRLDRAELPEGREAPIGRPLPNYTVYVLDARGEPVPIGIEGELYIGGDSVARGYLDRPELTAEKFVDNPFGPGRLYRTGDLVRWRADGNLEFVGRADDQVKIRGYRIELGEIEGALVTLPDVEGAVVIAREDRPGIKRLVAYVTGSGMETAQLRAQLAQRLPEYMIPSAFVWMERLPITATGKVDRKALPDPDDEGLHQRAYTAPQSEAEQTLAAIWCELLGVPRVGRDDNFFELGGHSLNAVQLMERLRQLGLESDALFSAPTLAQLAATLTVSRERVVPENRIVPGATAITPEQLPLIDLTQADIDQIIASVPGGVSNIEDIYALVPMQEGMLFHHQAQEEDPYLALRWAEFPDRELVDRYLAAMQKVVDRHDVLRTAFLWRGLSTPAQVVWREAPLPILEVELDVAADPRPALEQLVERFDARTYRMDLGRAPLMHFVVAHDPRIGRWYVLELAHHLIGDDESEAVLHDELEALLAGREHELPTPCPFRNLVATVRSGDSGDYESYFRSLLGDIDETTAPFGVLESHGDGRGLREGFRRVPGELLARLRTQARRFGVSVATLSHVAWAQVVARTTGREQVVFGTVLFGRMHSPGADRALGLYMNTLPIRVHVDSTSVEDAVRKTHVMLAELMKYEHAPLALAQRCSAIASTTPLFTALLNYRHGGVDLAAAAAAGISSAAPAGSTAMPAFVYAREATNYPILLSVDDDGAGLGLSIQVVDSISPDRLGAMMERAFEQLALALEEAPEQPVRALDVLLPEERRLVVDDWNATARDYPRGTLHGLFEAQVDRTPDALALVFGDLRLTYRELDERANRLANYLRVCGAGPGVLVGIFLERTAEIVVALLGALKSGAAYVPLDPAYPKDRITAIYEEARPAVLVTESALDGRLPVLGARIVRVDHDAAQIASAAPSRLADAATSTDLSHVIFTSGSTGRPKGVAIEHSVMVNYVHFALEVHPKPELSAWLFATSVCFDGSLFEVFIPLACGGHIFVVENLFGLPSLDEDAGVTCLYAVPSVMSAFLQTGTLPRSLQAVSCAGEPLSNALVRQLHDAGVPRVYDFYGPTETFICTWTLRSGEGPAIIGRPIANMQNYVLDARGEPAPIGVPGELYVGGEGLARGYYDKPALTSERFVPNPFGPGRLYKTGDFARWLPDGTLQYIGRIDHQVKIRGLRIELAEIEIVLGAHPAVRDKVVIAREDTPGDKRLVAYIVGRNETVDVESLREHVSMALPGYMVPSAFVVLDAMPLTPNGKTDRKALPAPEAPASRGEYRAPQTQTEELLAGIWCELLGVERVGADDHFFELGGHSLLGMRLVARIRQMLGVDVTVRALFEAPTLSGLASVVGEAAAVAAPPLVPISRDGALVASFGQQRFWVMSQLAEGAAYDMSQAVRVRGALDVVALSRAIDALVARHEVLRTTLYEVDGQVLQRIAPAPRGMLSRVTVGSFDEARTYFEQLVAKPYDLTTGPLFQPVLVRISDDDHVLVLRMHHAASDEWSVDVLWRELTALYQGETLPPLNIQYADVAAWQRAYLVGDVFDRQLEYWRDTLAGTSPLELPTDRPRPAVLGVDGVVAQRRMPASVGRAVEQLGRRHGATPFMTYLAAFYVLLHRYCNQEDITVGTPVANRGRAEIDSLIGYFLNTLALRVDVSGASSGEALLAQVRDVALGAYAHQDVPFERVVEALRVTRTGGRSPLFQVMFVHQRAPMEGDVLGHSTDEVQLEGRATAKFELTLTVIDGVDSTTCDLEANAALFDAATLERMLEHYQRLVESLVAEPSRPVGELTLLGNTERDQLLIGWNAPARDYGREGSIHEWFEEQVARTPDAIAVAFQGQRLTYRELDARANQLGHHLVSLGVGPDVLVAMCVERSIDLVVGVLGILKAGGAYVPLDPSYPAERLAFTLEDAAPAVIVGHAALLSALPAHRAHVVRLDADTRVLAGMSSTRLPRSSSAQHLAYVIYTSGSTGRPKGVQITHGNVTRLFTATEPWFGFDSNDVWTLFHSYAFDFSVWELWGALLYGGRLVVVPHLTSRSADDFRALLAAEQVTVLNQTPSAFYELVRADSEAEDELALRLVIFGGEALSFAKLAPWFERHGDRRPELVNMYGITETTVHVTYRPLRAEDVHSRATSAIGRAIPDLQLYVLDAHFQPVPIGVAGELFVGGAGLARGYLNRPELTAARFVANPFGDGRLYRTGDLVRWLANGELDYLGRIDQQVKIRGFRIELGEIESVLASHPLVGSVAVIAREDQPGDKRLVAYVVSQGGAITIDALRAHAAVSLPEHMVPSAFVLLDALPLTENGKLDRKRLPAPDVSLAQRPYVAPRTETEERLARIWCDVLGVDRVGADDNFFELGGHSLLVMRLVARIRQTLGAELTVRAVFEAPTLSALAAVIAGSTVAAGPPLVPIPRDGMLVASFGQQRFWVMAQLAEGAAYDMSEAVRIRGALDEQAMSRAFDALVARHEVLRTTLVEVDGNVLQRIAPAREGALSIIDVQTFDDARDYVEENVNRPYDLTTGPLFEPVLLRISSDEHVLLLRMHHAASDEWSMDVLWREIVRLYQGHELAPLAIQYADFAVWQRACLGDDALARQLAYWRAQLAGAAPLALPTDRPRPVVLGVDGVTAHRRMPSTVGRAIEQLGGRYGTTPFMTYLAAFYMLLNRYSHQDDISVGTPVASRGRAETDALIGYFLNTLALRVDLSGNPTGESLIGQVRDVALAAYAHQDVPFEQVVEALRVPRDAGRSPLFQAAFVHQRSGSDDRSALGLELEDIDLTGRATAKFELTLTVVDGVDGTTCYIEANAALFDVATLDRMLQHYERLIESLVAEPSRPLSELALLADAERQQLLVEWNATQRDYPRDACLHELFEAQTDRTPDAVAVVFEQQSLTYRELDERTNQLAHHLRALGVGPEVRVAICVRRSLDMIVSVLGILKAGGAYVPIDPAYPADRIAFMLEDAAAPIVVAHADLTAHVTRPGTQVVPIDGDRAVLARLPVTRPPRSAGPHNVAYVIYTSGSTGRPKGVVVEHHMVVNLTVDLGQRYGLGPTDRMTQTVSLSFDGSVLEIFPALSFGAALVLRGEDMPTPDELFGERYAGVTVMFLITAYWQTIIGHPLPASLRLVVIGGDRALPEHVRAWSERAPSCRLLNLYGPTEATVAATGTFLRGDDLLPGREVPIGAPLVNACTYVLGPHGEVVPLGVPGELYIGGVGVARGYLGRPELTAERFVPDPFSPVPGARMYRTGDLVRWFANGTLEYLGRVDQQVKIRGFRIELGEIETALAAHPAVREVAVLAREDAPGEKRLVAYVVGRDAIVDIDALRAHVSTTLPDYMVPSAFVALEAMPLMPSGKLDRKALPAPELADVSQRAYIAPRTDAEVMLAGIWCEVLGVQRVGADDHFFELGGHSLLGMRLVSRVRQMFGVDLTVRAVFEAPTLSGLAAMITGSAAAAGPALVPVPRDGTLLASFGQQRFWVMAQLAEGAAYDMSQVVRLHGVLDVQMLAGAFDSLVERHEILRTTLAEIDGQVVQRIASARKGVLSIVDVHTFDEARAHIERLLHQPYDLATGPLFEPVLVRIGANDHALVLRMHHAMGDEWSVDVLWQELSALYRGQSLPPLPVQYADFAAWQRERLAGDVLTRQLAYWRARLAGASLLELPTDRPRPAVLGIDGLTTERRLPSALGNAVEQLGQRHGTTPFMTYLAAFYMLLQRYTHQDDITVGTPVANRGRVETDALIGYFLNTLALRVDLTGNPSVRRVLEHVRDVVLGAQAHQDVPFERVVEELRVPRDAGRSPVFQVMFAHYRAHAADHERRMLGLDADELDLGADPTAKFELTLSVTDSPDGVTCSFEANAELFDRSTLERMLAHYQSLLEEIVDAPTRSIGELALLTPVERQQLLVDWNATTQEYPREKCLHELFEAQADQAPDAIAIELAGATMTYGELDRRANQLAHHLRALGVGTEVRVGLCVERRLDMYVALLGILKAGGAYVPVEPTLPPDRIASVFGDAGVSIVVTHAHLAEPVARVRGTLVAVDDDGMARRPVDRPVSGVRSNNLAYVIYTSGSTGRPKGVEIEHRMAVNEVFGLGALEHVMSSDRVLQFASLAFDASIEEIFIPLSRGATLVARGSDVPVPSELYGPAFAGLTVMNMATAYWHALATSGSPPPSLRLVVIGGERAQPEHVRSWLDLAPNCVLLNTYGPTETSIVATVWKAHAAQLVSGREVPIGGPLPNYTVYVLDPRGQPVPVGVPGELYVGGDGVARGYLGRPDLTAERFVKNPFGAGRLYRTGDRVRWMTNGTLEYLGRSDEQLKIRGFRIEPGEIESTLSAHASVREVAVLAREDVPGDKRLVAYVVGGNTQVDIDALRVHATNVLPEYMVPSAFVVLEAMPLTPNGKLDRKALPVPEVTKRATGLARSRTELALARIVAATLRLPQVGPQDDFFALGGHSLLAARLLGQIQRELGVQLPVSALFRAPTIEALAREISAAGSGPTRTGQLVPLRAGGQQAPLVCVHAIGGSVYAYQHLVARLGPERAYFGFEARGLDGQSPSKSVAEMAEIYSREWLAARGTGPLHLLGWSFGGAIVLEMAHALRAAGADVASVTLLDSYAPSLTATDVIDAAEVYATLAFDLGLDSPEVDVGALRSLGPDAARERVEQLARAASVLPPQADGDELAIRARVLEAHMRALVAHVPRRAEGRVTLIQAEESERTVLANGWADYIPTLEIVRSSGDHYSILQPPRVDALAALLERIMRS